MLKKIVFLCVIICAVIVTASSQEVNASIVGESEFVSDSFQIYTGTETTPTPEVTTTLAPTTSAPTTAAPTTAAPTTSSSTKSTSTTSTTSTSTTPYTTKSPPTTPKPKPKPFPNPQIGNWSTPCILIKMAAQFNITYETKDNKNMTGFLNLPKSARVEDNTCTEMLQTLTLQWGTEEDVNSLHLIFAAENNTYFLQTLTSVIQLIGDEFPNAKDNATIHLTHRATEFKTPMKMSYACKKEQDLNLTRAFTEKPNSFIKLMSVQFEAFGAKNITEFSAEENCLPNVIQDAIPIAVGLALSLLILIVLVSFLVARRRSSARGYMSF